MEKKEKNIKIYIFDKHRMWKKTFLWKKNFLAKQLFSKQYKIMQMVCNFFFKMQILVHYEL